MLSSESSKMTLLVVNRQQKTTATVRFHFDPLSSSSTQIHYVALSTTFSTHTIHRTSSFSTASTHPSREMRPKTPVSTVKPASSELTASKKPILTAATPSTLPLPSDHRVTGPPAWLVVLMAFSICVLLIAAIRIWIGEIWIPEEDGREAKRRSSSKGDVQDGAEAVRSPTTAIDGKQDQLQKLQQRSMSGHPDEGPKAVSLGVIMRGAAERKYEDRRSFSRSKGAFETFVCFWMSRCRSAPSASAEGGLLLPVRDEEREDGEKGRVWLDSDLGRRS